MTQTQTSALRKADTLIRLTQTTGYAQRLGIATLAQVDEIHAKACRALDDAKATGIPTHVLDDLVSEATR